MNFFIRRPAWEAAAIAACAEAVVAVGIFAAGFALTLRIWP